MHGAFPPGREALRSMSLWFLLLKSFVVHFHKKKDIILAYKNFQWIRPLLYANVDIQFSRITMLIFKKVVVVLVSN